ncbi:hypothetical protein SteCoe_4720 [Stentor coeruleus]|uniref:EF-hand domain-containing protein n=1 Tax=Stentor coeruleus TaxID=5963 RepID=A0A1R2CU30_9CILI|nr:hypothetical protein SteCoe_4720 [Stentor coeruleus]
MLSIETESKLAEIFLRISHSERSVEECRHYLSSNSDFDPYSTFRGVDHLGIGSFSSTEMLALLDKHRFFSSTDEAYLSIKQYDSNQDGRLSIDEFFSLVLPSTNPVLKSIAMSRRGYFTQEVELLFIRLIQSEISFHRNIENARRALILRHDFTIPECFRTIDIRNFGFIDRLSLQAFLRRHRNVNEEDIDAIFRRLDNDGDDTINYQEFTEAVMPSQASEFRSFRRTSALDSYAQTDRSYQDTSSQRSYRKSSPLRNPNLKESMSSSSLRKSFASSSPSRYTLSAKPSYSSLRSTDQSIRKSSPLRSSPLRSSRGPGSYHDSAYKTSSPLRATNLSNRGDTAYKTSSPLRATNLSITNRSFHPNLDLTSSNLNDTQGSLRRSSPSRRSSPLRKSVTDRSNFNESRAQNSSRSKILGNTSSMEEKELVNWFQEEIKITRDVERKKNELALKHDFNLTDAFRMFDPHDYGSIAITDFEDTFRFLSFNAPRDELYLLIKHFSQLQNNRLTFSDFTEILLPKQQEYARILRNRLSSESSAFDRLRVFSRETIELFLSTFRLILDSESLAERVRQRLSREPNFNLHQAFMIVDKDRNGFITIDEFQSILQSHGIFATSKDLQNLLHKYDKNHDGKVSYSEFVEEVTPKSPRRY